MFKCKKKDKNITGSNISKFEYYDVAHDPTGGFTDD